MATQQIPTNPQNSNHNPMMYINTGNPIADAVTALRAVVKRFKGEDKEFEALFAVCLDSVEKGPQAYEQSLIWHDAFLYLADNDTNNRRGAIVESIARHMVAAYEQQDDLPPPPQYTVPIQSEEPSSQPPAKDPIISPTMDDSVKDDADQGSYDKFTHKRQLAPSAPDREIIHWQLHFIAMAIGNGYQLELTENAYCGLMHLLFEVADKVFPEYRN